MWMSEAPWRSAWVSSTLIEADDRRVVLGFEQVLDLRHLAHQAREVHVLLEVVGDVRGGLVGARIGFGEAPVEGLRRLERGDAHRHAEHAAQLRERLRRGALAQAYQCLCGRELEEQRPVRLGERVRDEPRRGFAHCRSGRTGGSTSGSTGCGSGLVCFCASCDWP